MAVSECNLMTELISELFSLLDQIPVNFAIGVLGLVIIFIVKRQDKMNKTFLNYMKEADEKFAKGSTNFKMIDDHFLSVHKHFNTLHEENRYSSKINLKNIIYNESIDPHERQEAYDDYVARGGNGTVKIYYETVLEPLVREHTGNKRGR